MFDFDLLKDIDILDKIDDTKEGFNKEEADVIIRFFVELLMKSMIELSEELGEGMSDELKTVLKDCLDVGIKSYIEKTVKIDLQGFANELDKILKDGKSNDLVKAEVAEENLAVFQLGVLYCISRLNNFIIDEKKTDKVDK